MSDKSIYLIELDGQVSENEINANSPIEIAVMRAGATTEITACTDQSGLIGLLRHLHSRGLVLLSVKSDQMKTGEENAQ